MRIRRGGVGVGDGPEATRGGRAPCAAGRGGEEEVRTGRWGAGVGGATGSGGPRSRSSEGGEEWCEWGRVGIGWGLGFGGGWPCRPERRAGWAGRLAQRGGGFLFFC